MVLQQLHVLISLLVKVIWHDVFFLYITEISLLINVHTHGYVCVHMLTVQICFLVYTPIKLGP